MSIFCCRTRPQMAAAGGAGREDRAAGAYSSIVRLAHSIIGSFSRAPEASVEIPVESETVLAPRITTQIFREDAATEGQRALLLDAADRITTLRSLRNIPTLRDDDLVSIVQKENRNLGRLRLFAGVEIAEDFITELRSLFPELLDVSSEDIITSSIFGCSSAVTPRLRAPILRAFKDPETLEGYRRIFKAAMKKTTASTMPSTTYSTSIKPKLFADKYITLAIFQVLFGPLTPAEENNILECDSDTSLKEARKMVKDLFARAKTAPTPIFSEMIAEGFTDKEMLICIGMLLTAAEANPPLALADLMCYLGHDVLADAIADKLSRAYDGKTPAIVVHMVKSMLASSPDFSSMVRKAAADLIVVLAPETNSDDAQFLRIPSGDSVIFGTKTGPKFDPEHIVASADESADKKTQPKTMPFSGGIHRCPAEWLAMELLCTAIEEVVKEWRVSSPRLPEGAVFIDAANYRNDVTLNVKKRKFAEPDHSIFIAQSSPVAHSAIPMTPFHFVTLTIHRDIGWGNSFVLKGKGKFATIEGVQKDIDWDSDPIVLGCSSDGRVWDVSLTLSSPLEFKICIQDQKGDLIWEKGENRVAGTKSSFEDISPVFDT